MNSNDGGEKLLALLMGLIVLIGGFFGLAILTNRFACEEWAAPESMFDIIGLFTTGSMSAFGTTSSGCYAETWHLALVLGIGLLLIAIIATTIIVLWLRYKQSDKYLVRQLRWREGMAKGPEIRKAVGPKAAKKAVGNVRPSVPKRQRKPEQACFRLGEAERVPTWASLEESMLLLGPPRSGKGVGILVGAIIDAPGPVITTSSRADNLALTMHKRAEKGPVAVFDPQGLSGQKTNFKWSPISGCESPQVANQRATSLISSAGLSEDSQNAEWAAPAVGIMECLLHAAALDKRTVDDLMLWGSSLPEAREAVKILKEHPAAAPGWAQSLEGVINEDPKMRGNKAFGVANAVKGLAVPNVRAAMKPMSEAETFDIDNFLEQNGTLYIVGTKTGGSSAGPFLIAMMDAITEHARQKAAKRKGNRLDPPLALILDEIANIATAWPGLIQLMADGGGVGISPFAVCQSLAQVKKEWGQEAAAALWEAATIKLLLGGASDTDTLETIQKIAGTYEHRRQTRSSGGGGGTTRQEQFNDKNVLEISEIRRLPTVGSPAKPHALMFYRRSRPILLKVRPFFERPDAKEISANKKRYYAENGVNEETGRVESWQSDPGNRPGPVQKVAEQVYRQAESVAESQSRLAGESLEETQARLAGAEGSSQSVADDEDDDENLVVVPAKSASKQPRGVLWG